MIRALALLAALAACKGKHAKPAPKDAAASRDAAAADAANTWPELATFPQVEPLRVIALPAKPDVPRFDVGGPIVLGDVAAVASSQFGFIGVDYERGQIAWRKPAGLHVAPPLVQNGSFVLIGDCLQPPAPPAGEVQLGCARIVTPLGADQAYVQIHGKAVSEFAIEPGQQRVWSTGEHSVAWRRGERAVAVDLMTGAATPIAATEQPVIATYKDRTWQITRTEDGIIEARGKPDWKTERSYSALLGTVYLPGQAPMIRLANLGHWGGNPEILLFDIDATGSMHGQVSFPVPGISLLGSGIDSVGDVALAVRLDASLERDFIAGYAANAALIWVYPLPRTQRTDQVGIAVARDAVVVFHDGDLFTILPELSAPPTAPGAVRPPSENPTP